MPEFFDSPDFALTAITLRGVGSYRTGQRLEIKPLTIICGPNGSGKSTWLKALHVLREALDEGLLPFQFGKSAEHLTNACYYNFEVGENGNYVAEPEIDHDFGPPGTIGIEFEATRDVKRTLVTFINWAGRPEMETACRWWFDSEIFPKGTKFQLRMAHPRFFDPKVSPRHLVDFVELTIDGAIRFRLVGPLDPYQKGTFRSLPLSLFLASDSPAFVKEIRENFNSLKQAIQYKRGFDVEEKAKDLVTNGEVDKDGFTASNPDPLGINQSVALIFQREIQNILRSVLDGCFSIGALREFETSTDLNENRKRILLNVGQWWRPRYVGSRGEHSWALLNEFTEHLCRSTHRKGLCLQDVIKWFGHCDGSKICKAILKNAPESLRRDLTTEVVHPEQDLDGVALALIRFLENEVESPAVFDDAILREVESIEDPEIQHFLNRMRSGYDLSKSELQLFKTLVINEVSKRRVNNDLWEEYRDAAGYPDEGYRQVVTIQTHGLNPFMFDKNFAEHVSECIDFLTGHVLVGGFDCDSERFGTLSFPLQKSSVDLLPFPFRLLEKNQNIERDENDGPPDFFQTDSLRKIHHACFGKLATQTPGLFSAGFHQVFPIVLQMIAARPFEVVTIENPEVHLHPKLIRSLTEYLVSIADSFRNVIIETHSDLLVRRVARALLEESISQSKVAIQFVDLRDSIKFRWTPGMTFENGLATETCLFHGDPNLSAEESENLKDPQCDLFTTTFAESHLEQIRFDKHNRIINWPKGFLDEEEDEADRIIEAMSQFPFADDADANSRSDEVEDREDDEVGDSQ